jgi:3-phosphoshikimate 1-carboxyvinyltransferase
MSRNIKIRGPGLVWGQLQLPGDKSISHRVALMAAVAEGASKISRFATSADCASTLECLKRLGIGIEQDGAQLQIEGRGLHGFKPETNPVRLWAGNSGSTIRMLSGLLAGQDFCSEIDGDHSLRKRPMSRIIEPLSLMGASIESRSGLAPLRIEGRPLKAIDYTSPVASAQVKTCVLLAGLLAEGTTSFSEPALSRNHTEIMLREFGAELKEYNGRLHITGGARLKPVDYSIPGDTSSAAFFVAAAAMLPDSKLTLRGICLNPTRTAFLEVISRLGADIKLENIAERHGEPVGDLVVKAGPLAADDLVISGATIPRIIDEIPILAVVATQIRGRIQVRDASELRVKESDRIRTVAEGIRALGGQIEEFQDGFAIRGPQKLIGGRIDSAGDHRIAMAFSIAGLAANGTTEIIGADSINVSFPEFYQLLAEITYQGWVSDAG